MRKKRFPAQNTVLAVLERPGLASKVSAVGYWGDSPFEHANHGAMY